MINQAVCIDSLDNHILCPMKCHLNGVHISEVPKFLAESPSETTHAIKLVDPFNAAHSLTIPLQLSNVTIYFDVYSLSVTDENKDIAKIHLITEEPPWDPSANDYSEKETSLRTNQYPCHSSKGTSICQHSCINSLACDTTDVMESDNLATTMSVQI